MPRALSASTAKPHRLVDTALSITTVLVCAAMIAYKFLLTSRLNVNWDEFYYLNFVHAQARGELTLLLQGAFVHLFSWLPGRGDEMQQIVAARLAMVGLLGITATLVWALGRRWLAGSSAFIPPLVYLTSLPVVLHGGSFRSDSLLVPLLIGALVLLAGPKHNLRKDLVAGVMLGTAFAMTVKVVLFAPIVGAMLAFRELRAGRMAVDLSANSLRTIGLTAFAALTTASLVLVLQWLTIPPSSHEPIVEFGARTVRKTLLEVPWFAQHHFLLAYAHWQPLSWSLLAAGWMIAMVRRRWDLASLGLALLPIAIYRNSFSYFYVVMLAPASVLAGYATQEAIQFVARHSRSVVASILAALLWAGLLHEGLAYAGRFGLDRQTQQRVIVAGVHQVFPDLVNYVDRCGMISSYRKVNPFMSTWGMENYRERNVPFMPAALSRQRPAFVLENTIALNPSYRGRNSLLSEDAATIRDFYPTYWGPLRVAGGQADLTNTTATRIQVPFPDGYRLFSSIPIIIDGEVRQPGDVITVGEQGALLQLPKGSQTRVRVALFLATANPPPNAPLPNVPIFDGL